MIPVHVTMSRLLCLILVGASVLPVSSQAQALLSREDDKIFEVVEDPPLPWLYKTHCRQAAADEKQACYLAELNRWMTERLQYPAAAMDARTEGTVVIRFIVDRSGAIRDAEVLKDIGDGCGEAALDVVRSMPDWVPGRQRGKPVHVRFTLPVRFRLK